MQQMPQETHEGQGHELDPYEIIQGLRPLPLGWAQSCLVAESRLSGAMLLQLLDR